MIVQQNANHKAKGIHFPNFDNMAKVYESFKEQGYNITWVTVHELVNDSAKFKKYSDVNSKTMMRLSTKDMGTIRIKAECTRGNKNIESTFASNWWHTDFKQWTLIKQEEWLLNDDGRHIF